MLYRRILVYAENGTQNPDDATGLAGVCDWVIENVQLSTDVKAQIHAAKSKLMVQARRGEHRD